MTDEFHSHVDGCPQCRARGAPLCARGLYLRDRGRVQRIRISRLSNERTTCTICGHQGVIGSIKWCRGCASAYMHEKRQCERDGTRIAKGFSARRRIELGLAGVHS